MEESADRGELPIMENARGELRQPERRNVRRRLVQSTLFPHKPQETEVIDDQKADKDCNADEEGGEDYDCTESQGKKKKKRKGKTTTPTKASKKPKEKSLADTTPKKHAKSNGKVLATLIEIEDGSPPPMPNLRLEAKMTAEENSRMFSGRQIHPFFSSWKAGKRCEETNKAERKDNRLTIGPIHVFDKVQGDDVSFDWRNWSFCEKCSTSTTYDRNGESPSILEASVDALPIDQLSTFALHAGASPLRDKASLDQCLIQLDGMRETTPTISTMSANEHVGCCSFVKGTEMDCTAHKVDIFSSSHADGVKKSDARISKYFQERMMSYYIGSSLQLDGRIWADKYQPKRAIEVCGNEESVKFLSEWLRLWRERDHKPSKNSIGGDESNIEDTYDEWYPSDTDSGNIDGPRLKNLLLVTGPVGSGKSAAIYACAMEQGFKIFEANVSDCRNGAAVKQRFGEVLESHSLNWSKENPVDSRNELNVKSCPSTPNGKPMLVTNEVIELDTLDEEGSNGIFRRPTKFALKETGTTCARDQLRPLILFEDVDIVFPEDRGFIAAIQYIAERAKGPVILTSNSKNPILPDTLDRIEVCFALPSSKELFCHIYKVCAVEKADIQSWSIERLIRFCEGDIRKTIMHLQFWCQGINFPGREVLGSRPLPIDHEAAHQMLPKILPWELPSQLSELVEKEISKSLSIMEDDSTFADVIEEEFNNKAVQDNPERHVDGMDCMEAKKEAMLSWNGFFHNCDDFAGRLHSPCKISNSPGTPVSFCQRKGGKRLNVVMSSDSEDDGKLKENHNQCLDLHFDDTCKSVDISIVPESTVVPETEVGNGTELLSKTVFGDQDADTFEEVSMNIESKQNPFSVEADILEKSVSIFNSYSDMLTCDVIVASSCEEDLEDSLNEHEEDATREYQPMDECSRMAFSRKPNPTVKHRSSWATSSVQKSWDRIRNHQIELSHCIASERTDACQITKLANRVTNMISEADILLSKCRSLDLLELSSIILPETSDAFSWCDEQSQMTSTILQHGLCYYAKQNAAVGMTMGSESMVNLAPEVPSTANTSGNLIQQPTETGRIMEGGLQKVDELLNSDKKSCLFDIIQSIVPSRLYLALKCEAFHDYLSSLAHISRTEVSHLSKSIGKTKRRRTRSARHYLSTGALMLSAEEISLLGEHKLCGKISSQSTDTDIR
ncbi:uncharacterized protein LOC120010394 isoform X2 [Tripterygium wilfordii]|uniref:uncharacterized protein LOC120010394 isoform X2 n=1 Tax=Tripterygium wilfordii TaxID=458696 RepID=UPI0018F82AD0|nr:uncharacterized protein LOC120010394 isoform X2 [Tripterygium wilfordii]